MVESLNESLNSEEKLEEKLEEELEERLELACWNNQCGLNDCESFG